MYAPLQTVDLGVEPAALGLGSVTRNASRVKLCCELLMSSCKLPFRLELFAASVAALYGVVTIADVYTKAEMDALYDVVLAI